MLAENKANKTETLETTCEKAYELYKISSERSIMIVIIPNNVAERHEQLSSNLHHCFELKLSCSVFDMGPQSCLCNVPKHSAHMNLYI